MLALAAVPVLGVVILDLQGGAFLRGIFALGALFVFGAYAVVSTVGVLFAHDKRGATLVHGTLMGLMFAAAGAWLLSFGHEMREKSRVEPELSKQLTLMRWSIEEDATGSGTVTADVMTGFDGELKLRRFSGKHQQGSPLGVTTKPLRPSTSLGMNDQ